MKKEKAVRGQKSFDKICYCRKERKEAKNKEKKQ